MSKLRSSQILFGGDYNPEQWPESVWEEDMRLMKAAGVNLVSIGIFGWARLQSRPGIFHFEWLDRLMDLLAENAIQADLATATASPPAWLVHRHPEILPRLDNGVVLSPGARQHYNPSSSAYRRACVELVTAMATRYKDHPALAMWHINNEYACHVPADYGDETAVAFREWLKRRHLTLDALNEAWGTAFWSQHYYEWDEILPPRTAPTFANPGQCLDFQRFSSDALLECCQLEAEILRRITPGVPVTTNFMEWFKPLDYRKWSATLDFTCLDIYPEPTGSSRPLSQNADMTRSWKNGAPWMIMEQVTTHVNWRARNATKRPGLMRLWSYVSLARGADGICFFQWRKSKAGAEKFHGAMIGHGDPSSQRCYREVVQLGSELSRLSSVAGSRFTAETAVLFDHENWWALELPGKPNNQLTYARGVENFYGALLRQNIATDFVFPDSDLSTYRLVFVPSLYLVKPGLAEKLEAFTSAGGTVVVGYFSGIVDERDHVLLGGYPAPLRNLLGLTVEEWAVPPDDRAHTVTTCEKFGLRKRYSGSFWQEVVRTGTAETVATFDTDFLQGLPAVTRHEFGRGRAWYLGTDLEPAFYDDLVRHLADDVGVTAPLATPAGVEVTRRTGVGKHFLFLLNHTDKEQHIDLADTQGHELLTGREARGNWMLPPFGVAIVESSIS